ncbi:thiopeptide maturation pyridine synthase [Streptomyces sp. NBC_01198]|uniref:thiopeptide maturation pyridine synthase n=1 Tax=Streptomyces sp. NBC_01198 TaxID=2903769 RepID=UPI002E13BF8F|nr:hypothetical protein OG702_02285 [Streptomyces sp. NBC_01198]
MTEPAGWHTLRVDHFADAGRSDLILDAVRPLFGELSGQVGAAYFLQHWRRGPHLRLNVLTTPEVLDAVVLPAADRTVGAHLRERPSRSALDVRALLPRHRELAAVELDDRPLGPPSTDNTLSTEPYDSRAGVLGGPAAAALIAGFYVAANPAAFSALEAARAERQRLWAAFDLMAATAHLFSGGGVSRGYVSFRAHADTHLTRTADQRRTRAAWDRLHRAAAPALAGRLRQVVTAVDSCGGPPHVRDWAAALRTVREPALALADAGGLTMDHPSRPARGSTPFLRELLANEDFQLRMKTSVPFRRYRLLLNLLYLQLTRIGIRPDERYLLCHLVAGTVEDAYGVDAATVVRETSAALREQR